MNIFFDMDYTLLGADGSLRPGAREVMRRLKADGHAIYVWSGVGIRWTEVYNFGLDPFVTNCFVKPLDSIGEMPEQLQLPVEPDLVIDDHPGIVASFGGIWVRPYVCEHPYDSEMERIYRTILAMQPRIP